MADQTIILFVDDNADLRDNAALLLGMSGYHVEAACDGQEALQILDGGVTPHLIISDIMMPRLDGFEFFRAVQQQRHLKRIPFIFLTARGSRHDISAGRRLGVDDYLVKPFDPEEFLLVIRHKLRRTAEMRADAAERLDEARQHLVALMSHELRTPLTYVSGGFALLADELKRQQPELSHGDLHVSLELIQNGTQRLSRLAEQMVLYSEIISGYIDEQIEAYGEPVGLGELVSDALYLVGDLVKERATTFERVLHGGEALSVVGVRKLLVEALGEILRNAIQFSPAGSAVHIRLVRDETYASVHIIDHGPGIPDDDKADVWSALTQSRRDETEQQGAGMGLPIVKGIVAAHRGEIELLSAPGGGTEVMLRLPLAPPSYDAP